MCVYGLHININFNFLICLCKITISKRSIYILPYVIKDLRTLYSTKFKVSLLLIIPNAPIELARKL